VGGDDKDGLHTVSYNEEVIRKEITLEVLIYQNVLDVSFLKPQFLILNTERLACVK
jgi:hypothetical protein